MYQCTDDASYLFCGQDAYNPITGQSNLKVWESLGSCDSTIVLALSDYPGYEELPDEGGCPDEYEYGEAYVSGDRVSREGLVYECVTGSNGLHCPQAGYEPGEGTAFADAWTVVGTCSGTIGPTSSPSFDALELVGGCPDEWEVKAEGYKEGDRVSALGDGENKLVFECGAYPQTGHCGQAGYEPGLEDIQGVPAPWKGVWAIVGYCSGSIGPTSSPTFDELVVDTNGCPQEWSASNTDYKAGELVSYVLSLNPERTLVYECKKWPYTGFCNQGSGFEPTTQYGDMAWKIIGPCSGTLAPTDAPTPYSGTCEYVKGVVTQEIHSCTNGQTGCKCNSSSPPVCTREVDVTTPTPTPVDNGWQSGKDYEDGDVIRIGLDRYKCREWPNYLWCRQSAYNPETTPKATWSQAWRADGVCPSSPTSSPALLSVNVGITFRTGNLRRLEQQFSALADDEVAVIKNTLSEIIQSSLDPQTQQLMNVTTASVVEANDQITVESELIIFCEEEKNCDFDGMSLFVEEEISSGRFDTKLQALRTAECSACNKLGSLKVKGSRFSNVVVNIVEAPTPSPTPSPTSSPTAGPNSSVSC